MYAPEGLESKWVDYSTPSRKEQHVPHRYKVELQVNGVAIPVAGNAAEPSSVREGRCSAPRACRRTGPTGEQRGVAWAVSTAATSVVIATAAVVAAASVEIATTAVVGVSVVVVVVVVAAAYAPPNLRELADDDNIHS